MFSFERELHKCPAIEKKDIEKKYPKLSDESVEFMSLQSGGFTGKIHVYGYLRTNSDGEEYLEIDFYNECLYYPDKYRRFIIQKNRMMTEIDEFEFVNICHKDELEIDVPNFVYLQEDVREYIGNNNIRTYGSLEIGAYLLRIYFSTHKSGVREILYKANLERIAGKVNRMDEYNLIGRTPEEIVGLPLKLLRILENAGLEDRALNDLSRRKSRKVYARYSSYFGKDRLPNKYQWQYLEDSVNAEYEEKSFNPAFYNRLKECVVDSTFEKYKKYMILAEELGEHNPYKKIPNRLDVLSAVENMALIKDLIDSRGLNDAELKRNNMAGYDFEDDEFFTVTPVCIEDFINEAVAQDNCLLEFIEEVKKGTSKILFIRRKDNPKTSYLTMEICGKTINQVKARFNEDPPECSWSFIEKLASKFNLQYDEEDIFVSKQLAIW